MFGGGLVQCLGEDFTAILIMSANTKYLRALMHIITSLFAGIRLKHDAPEFPETMNRSFLVIRIFLIDVNFLP